MRLKLQLSLADYLGVQFYSRVRGLLVISSRAKCICTISFRAVVCCLSYASIAVVQGNDVSIPVNGNTVVCQVVDCHCILA